MLLSALTPQGGVREYIEYMHIFYTNTTPEANLLLLMLFYKPGEVNKSALKSLARQTFGCEPFDWQIATAIAVLEGRDVIPDISTGSGKTLAFSPASVLNKENIIIIISP